MSSIDELGGVIARHVPGAGIHRTALGHVSLVLATAPTMPMPTLYEPSVCFVASGSKRVELGSVSHLYPAATFLAVSVDLPLTGAVVDASIKQPFLCMRLDIDVDMLRELMLKGYGSPATGTTPVGLMRGEATPDHRRRHTTGASARCSG